MQLRYGYRLNPTPGQRQALVRAFGCARVVFNDAVAARRTARERGDPYPTDAALSKAQTAAKRTPERVWLAEVSAVVLQQALADANTAYRNFFASVKGTRKGRRLGAPRFRSKRDRAQSIRFTKAARFTVTPAGRLRLPGIGDVAVRWSRELPAEASSVTVTVDATGRHHASFVVDVPDALLPATGREVGIDLGLAQQELARRQKGSANRAKSRRKVAPCHARVADTRRDWLHKLPSTVVQENQLIAVEDLAVSGLARTRLARSVADAGWSTFVQMLAYKCVRAGRTFVKVNRWLPSTRACSACGAIGEAKPLHIREWTCPCGPTLVELVSAGAPVPQPAVKREPAGSTA